MDDKLTDGQMEIADDEKKEYVAVPTEVDVLCGRGGMSNHHPGNEWYRRLVRSNRPLYRACPKHTKLLVSKAIVQAVEQQGGRFLDRDKKSNKFFVVSYKRAVDKTSQGLRERERDEHSDDDQAESGSDCGRYDGMGRRQIEVPDGFSGRNTAPDMNDLATVAISMANGASLNSLKRTATDDEPSSPSKRSKQQVVVGKKNRSDLLADENVDSEVGLKSGVSDEKVMPPPALGSFQTSTYRLLNSGVPSGSINHENPANPSTFSHLQSQTFGMPPNYQPAITQTFHAAVPGIYLVDPAASSVPLAFLPVPMYDSSPPPLSRITSQVSDWLTSFWPLAGANDPGQETEEKAKSRKKREKALPSAIIERIKIPAPLENVRPQINQVAPPSRRFVHMQKRLQQKQKAKADKVFTDKGQDGSKPKSDTEHDISMSKSDRMATKVVERHDNQRQARQPLDQQSEPHNKGGFEKKAVTSKLEEGKHTVDVTHALADGISATLSKSSHDDVDDDNTDEDDVDDLGSTSPTDLEQSVSTTLLKLATGGLASGITAFFDKSQDKQ